MTDWAIPQQAKLKYTQLFNLHDRNRSGFLSGLQCRDILVQSGLPRNVLAEIWNLSDIDGDGQLTREEFILALHLTNHVRSGQSLPTELPADLVPPSYRRTSSIGSGASSSSVHSSSSAIPPPIPPTSIPLIMPEPVATQKIPLSTSVLNTNTFDDKRRENFEKGRAELEKRRLMVIESELNVLKDQLESNKKQLADAKSKIDAMRSDRDVKMGFITSLEAQLKAFQDRKVYLLQEEKNLALLANDLNLSNLPQGDSNAAAENAMQQANKVLKTKTDEVVKEIEFKDRQLKDSTTKLMDLRKELKSVVEKAEKTYGTYKLKIDEVKVLKDQFTIQNNAQLKNFDAVWDSFPNTTDSPTTTKIATQVPADDPWTSKTSTQSVMQEEPLKLKSNPLKYKAMYPFEARNPDELTITIGDVIKGVHSIQEPGWLMGELKGKTGLFPEAYVEKLPSSEPSCIAETEAIAKQHKIIISENKISNKFKAIYPFEARNPDELTINIGDIIVGIDSQQEPGWMLGELNCVTGLFPEAYVEKIPETVSSQVQEEGSSAPAKSKSKRPEVATVLAEYRALGPEQLSLEKGQLVLIRRKMDTGWWEGEVQVKGKKKDHGWFPANYVQLLPATKNPSD